MDGWQRDKGEVLALSNEVHGICTGRWLCFVSRMWGPPQIQQAAADRGCSEATRDAPGTDRGRKDTSNRLDFSINNGGVLTTVLVDPADYFWFQNQWVHIRMVKS